MANRFSASKGHGLSAPPPPLQSSTYLNRTDCCLSTAAHRYHKTNSGNNANLIPVTANANANFASSAVL